MPDFLADTAWIRDSEWKVGPIPADLLDRRVEITGPTERKMVINALNSGARVFMADFEDSNFPGWETLIAGQRNLFDAVRRTIEYTDPATGKEYKLGSNPAVLIVRPRGWHLEEKHMLVDGEPVSGALFDFGLYFFHNAHALLARGTGPYFYLPKMEHYQEAALWSDVFIAAEEALGLSRGTIKATVLIETILAAFQMDEILYALKDHIVGLNAGRWDYVFSAVKRFREKPEWLLPDRAEVAMTCHFLRSYSLLSVKTCHRRGAFAIGGMAAQIPIKSDLAANEAALAKVRADKEREARAGHDGTWVAHPGLVPLAEEIFNREMPTPNQVHRLREDVSVSAADLLVVPSGHFTEEGLRMNIRVGMLYLSAWLSGFGCVALYNLMEDAATAEISRAQVWQWLHRGAVLDDGRTVTASLVESLIDEEGSRIAVDFKGMPWLKEFPKAAALFSDLVMSDEFAEFLTLPAYELILTLE
jgi:malate synthase